MWLPEELESRRRSPIIVRDRGVLYTSHYDIGFVHAWSQSFSDASKRALDYSTGAHGLRDSYAKNRLYELIKQLENHSSAPGLRHVHEVALLLLSQELGHFRIDITFTYLR